MALCAILGACEGGQLSDEASARREELLQEREAREQTSNRDRRLRTREPPQAEATARTSSRSTASLSSRNWDHFTIPSVPTTTVPREGVFRSGK